MNSTLFKRLLVAFLIVLGPWIETTQLLSSITFAAISA